MLITNLGINTVSETMAKACNKYETDEGECWAERLNIGCPFSSDDFEAVSCDEIKPEHWREALADELNPKEKPEPRFRFGDKIRVDGMRAVFARYSDTSHKTAYILFESGSLLPERRVATLKAGWE